VRVEIVVVGKPNYDRHTLVSWVNEIKDVIELECGIEVELNIEDTNDELPKLLINDIVVLEGLPGEEGYLIEVLKNALINLGLCIRGTHP